MTDFSPFLVVQLVPAGIGAEYGGYAGDATPVTNLLASVADAVLAHPNVVNAAMLYAAASNVHYVEGGLLDRFMAGEYRLKPVRANRIGLVIDRAAEHQLSLLLNTADACRAVMGIDLVGYTLTEAPVGPEVVPLKSGGFGGRVAAPGVLLDACRRQLAKGADALAILTVLGEPPPEAGRQYEQGLGPDPIGGLEAVISRLVTVTLKVPAAHAPVIPYEPVQHRVDPRVAAEMISTSYLPCLLAGLSRAPRPVLRGGWGPEDVGCLVVPASCLGSPAVLAVRDQAIPVIAVYDNGTALSVEAEALGVQVLSASNYLEAAGMAAALKAGISLDAVCRPLLGITQT